MKFLTLSLITAAAVCGHALAQDAGKPAADNTATNARDRKDQTLTPVDQSNDPKDIKLTADIRKMVVEDETLSANAKNVKIITIDSVVTLRGPVGNAQEKSAIEQHARKAGATSVTNQIEIEQP